jgi:acyl-coenzyme A thioesterase PaaI-like protein
MASDPLMTIPEVEAFLDKVFPELLIHGRIYTVSALVPHGATVRMAYHPSQLRPGGTISGPSIMGLADLALFVALLGAIGPVDQAVTSNLNITFLRRPQPALLAECRLFRVGRRLASGDVALRSENSDAIVAHAVATYAIPEREQNTVL